MLQLSEAEDRAERAVANGAKLLKKRRQSVEFGLAAGRTRQYVGDCKIAKDMVLSRAMMLASWFDMTVDELADYEDPEEEPAGKRRNSWSRLIRRAQALFEQNANGCAMDSAIEMDSVLVEADDMRYKNPIRAKRNVEGLLEKLPSVQMPYAMNVLSSCFRMALEFDGSLACVEAGRQFARSCGNQAAFGDNLQRWVYLLCNTGNYTVALTKNKDSRETFIGLGNVAKLGETIVDRGYCLYQSGQIEHSLVAYLAAGNLQDYLSPRHNVSWSQAAGDCYRKLGEVNEARRLCKIALDFSRLCESALIEIQTNWVLARVEDAAGDFKACQRRLRKVAQSLLAEYPVDSLLASLELIAISLRRGESLQGSEIQEGLEWFIDEFSDVPQISAAVMDVLSLFRIRGRISAIEIEKACQEIARNRARFFRARAGQPNRSAQ